MSWQYRALMESRRYAAIGTLSRRWLWTAFHVYMRDNGHGFDRLILGWSLAECKQVWLACMVM